MVSYIDDTITVFKNDESLLTKTLIGIGIMMLSFLVLPAFLYQGYLMKILENTENGFPDELPEWSNYGELFKYGLIAFGFSLIGVIPGYALMIGPVLLGIDSLAILIPSIVGGFLFMLTFGYVSIGIFAIIFRESFSEVTMNKVKTILFSKDYFVGWFLITVIGVVFGLISLIINVFTLGFGAILIFPFTVPLNFATMLIMGVAVTESGYKQ